MPDDPCDKKAKDMSLRAYFAGQALEGILSAEGFRLPNPGMTAQNCLEYAAAMCAALETNGENNNGDQ